LTHNRSQNGIGRHWILGSCQFHLGFGVDSDAVGHNGLVIGQDFGGGWCLAAVVSLWTTLVKINALL
jgi:hypothetical protein